MVDAIPPSETELERRRFEAWAGSALGSSERGVLLTRSRGGEYVLPAAAAAWAAWQARPLEKDYQRQVERSALQFVWAHLWPAPWRFVEDGYCGGPCVMDAKGQVIVALFWPTHPVDQTCPAEAATHMLARAIAALVDPDA